MPRRDRAGKPSVEPWLRVGEAASLLGVSVRTLKRWVQQGKVKYRRLPLGQRELRFHRDEIERLIGSGGDEPTPPFKGPDEPDDDSNK